VTGRVRKRLRGYARRLWYELDVGDAPSAFRNVEGGSVEQHVDRRLQLHHCLNYAAALTALDGADHEQVGPQGQGLRLLEVGCGSGALSHALARVMPESWRLTATDYDETLVGAAVLRHRHPRLAFGRVNLLDVTTASLPSCDAVLMIEVIEHFDTDVAGSPLARLHAALRPGGRVVLTTLDRSGFPRRFSGYPPHRREYDRNAMAGMLANPRRNPFRTSRLWRLVSPRITRESIRAEERGGYAANRLNGLALELSRRFCLFGVAYRVALTAGLAVARYATNRRNGEFDVDGYLGTVDLCEDPKGELDGASFGLVAVLTR